MRRERESVRYRILMGSYRAICEKVLRRQVRDGVGIKWIGESKVFGLKRGWADPICLHSIIPSANFFSLSADRFSALPPGLNDQTLGESREPRATGSSFPRFVNRARTGIYNSNIACLSRRDQTHTQTIVLLSQRAVHESGNGAYSQCARSAC